VVPGDQVFLLYGFAMPLGIFFAAISLTSLLFLLSPVVSTTTGVVRGRSVVVHILVAT